jgi:hypothetical protein
MRHAPAVVAGIVALALLSGCSAPGSALTSATPASSATGASEGPAPASSPTPAPRASAAPSAAPAGASQCADAVAVDPEAAYTTRWAGSYEQQLASAQPISGFTPAELFASDEVLCTVRYRLPLDGGADAVGAFSVAYVRDATVREQVEAWAAEQGLVPQQTEDAAVYFTASSSTHDVTVSVEQVAASIERHERVSELDLQPTDLVVTHRSIEP